MDYFRKVLGGPHADGHVPSGAQTIERLCERVSSSTLIDDRRDAVRALKALSKKFKLEVGTQAMDILLNVLNQDRGDIEIIGYTMDTFCHIMSNEPSDGDDSDLGGQFTEIFIKKQENLILLLTFLDEYDFHVRWPTVKLLTALLTHRQKELQEIILVIPRGVSRLMDLLSDSREIIRNDALLLLNQLTKGHANIQKIIAFENAFERIIDIVREEGGIEGGIVCEDCLLLLYNLLRNNISNQNFFKEGSYIQKLEPFFHIEDEPLSNNPGWLSQKVTNMHLLLQLVRTLVTPNNPQNQTAACQKVMNQCGLLQDLCSILMASGVPADILTEAINTVAEVIRGNQHNQEYFASVLAPSTPPRPAIVVLLMSMVNEKQPFSLRNAVLYCFQCFLYKNEMGQSQIIQTLLPTTADVNSITAGQLLCGGLFSTDSLSNWYSAVALLHAVAENPAQKEQLLRVQLTASLGNPPVSLLQQCCNILSQGGKLQTRIGLLMILCAWLTDCPVAVSHFLTNATNVPFLISQVSSSEGEDQEIIQGLCAFLLGICILFNNDNNEAFSQSSLKQIIQNRIGLESFSDKLTQVAQNENYTKAAKKPHISYKHANEIVFDYEFTRLFKSLENEVLKAVSAKGNINGRKITGRSVEEYKNLLKEQDNNLLCLQQRLQESIQQNSNADKTIADLRSQVQQLKDQNALLKVQKATTSTPSTDELSTLRREVDNLRLLLQDKDRQLMATITNSQQINEDKNNSEHLETRQETSEFNVNILAEERIVMQERLNKSNEENLKLLNSIKVLKEEKDNCYKENQDLKDELETVKKEQDDLLELLADQDLKLNKYKTQLKDLGHEVKDDDDDEELDTE